MYTAELGPNTAVFVPRGVGNSYQALQDNTIYSYLVNEHWAADKQYLSLNLADPTTNIKWPISIATAEVSDKDKTNPFLANAGKMPAKKILITGGDGQLGTALRQYFPNADYVDLAEFNISDLNAYKNFNWSEYQTIINAAAYTNVDGAEAPEGRAIAWQANATALGFIARVALEYNLTIVHVSSDYVFDGTKVPHREDEPFSPLNVYGASKAAGDIAISSISRYYIIRTSWVAGKGNNFVKVMKNLADKSVKPSVVNDQLGRLTFAEDLAGAIHHLLTTQQPYGTYNFTNSGPIISWADIAKKTYKVTGHNPKDVTGVSTADYYKDKEGIAPRPLLSELDLTKITKAGYAPRDWQDVFMEYIAELAD